VTFEESDQALAAVVVQTIAAAATPFDIHGTRIRHARGAIEMWDAAIIGLSMDDIVEDADTFSRPRSAGSVLQLVQVTSEGWYRINNRWPEACLTVQVAY
jgi:hypothetical protein